MEVDMFNWFNWHKKESPLLGSFGLGGGVASMLNIAAPTAPVVGDHFEFQVWGGGGGAGGGGNGTGGGGAYVSVQYKILKGTTLRFIVGSGGRFFGSGGFNEVAYGGGGSKGTGGDDVDASTGAGLSGIFITDNPLYSAASPIPSRTTSSPPGPAGVVGPGLTVGNCLIIAAGGGGGGAAGPPSGGGGGGITTGGDGNSPIPGNGFGATWGGEGTDTGTAGSGGYAFAGGVAPGGGGGGSGLYGGGAGGTSTRINSGGGGSSYYWTTQSKPPAFVSYNPTSINSAGGNPGYAASLAGRVGGGPAPNNPGSFGAGGGPNGPGGDGRIAYRRHDSYEQLPLAEWVILDYTGDTQSLVV